jgi:hypothetical protein
MGGKAPAPPPAPDYVALAKQQAGLDRETARVNAQLNRVNQTDQYGNQTTYSQDANNPDQWTQTTTMSPEQQKLYEADTQAKLGLASAGQGLLGRATDAVSDPFSYNGMTDVKALDLGTRPTEDQFGDYQNYDYSKLGAMPDAGFGAVQQVQDAMMSRLDPALQKRRSDEQARLAAQGITQGGLAYQGSQDTLNRGENDANQQALLGAMGASGDLFNRAMAVRQQGGSEMTAATDLANALRSQKRSEGMEDYDAGIRNQLMDRATSQEDRNRQINEAMFQRTNPLNEFNSFMSGTQVQGPDFTKVNQATGSSAADIFGATQKQYLDNVDRANAAAAGKGNKAKGAASGAASGAAMGTMIMPGWGTAIGGVLGGLGGYLGG